jgi:hypothetical protein
LLKAAKAADKLKKETDKKQEAERVKDTKPSLPPDRYAGRYQSEVYGEVQVKDEKGKLVLQFGPSFVYDLEHWHYDTFRGKCRDRAIDKALVTFTLDAKGKVSRVQLQQDDDPDLIFKRAEDAAPAIALKEDELKKFVGKYELREPPLELRIELVGGKLKAALPGQPTLTIVPVKPTRFKVEDGPAGMYAEFALTDGKVKSVTLERSSGAPLILERKP